MIIQKLFVVWKDVLCLIEATQRSSMIVLTKRICSELQEKDCHCGCKNVYLVSLISLLHEDFRREISGCAHQGLVQSPSTDLSQTSHVDELCNNISIELKHDIVKFDVAVGDTDCMQIKESRQDLLSEEGGCPVITMFAVHHGSDREVLVEFTAHDCLLDCISDRDGCTILFDDLAVPVHSHVLDHVVRLDLAHRFHLNLEPINQLLIHHSQRLQL